MTTSDRMGAPPPRKRRADKSPHFFQREPDRSVRLRLKFTEEEADKIEDAAGTTPLMSYIHRAIIAQADYNLRRRAEADSLVDREKPSLKKEPDDTEFESA